VARVQFGAIVTELVGSIGGFTFQKNRSGSIVRLRGNPSRSATPKQTIAHQNHIRFLQLWQTLSSAERTLFNDFADTFPKTTKFGTVKTLTGQNWFESINFNRELFGLSVLTSPPAHDLPVALPGFDFVVGTSEIEIVFAVPFNPVDNGLIIETTTLSTRSTTSFRRASRLTKVLDSGPFSTIDLTGDWESTHGVPWPPGSGDICGSLGVMVRTVNKNSGIASEGSLRSDGVVTGEEGVGFWAIDFDFEVQ